MLCCWVILRRTHNHNPLLFSHGELDWHLEVRYQGGTTSHNNNDWISYRNLPHTYSGSSPVGTHYSIALQDFFLCAVSTLITVMRVPSLSVSPGASRLVLLLLLPVCYPYKYCNIKPHVKIILITVRMIQKEEFVTDGRRLWLVIQGHTSSNLWSLECRQRLGTLTNFIVLLHTLKNVRVTVVYIR